MCMVCVYAPEESVRSPGVRVLGNFEPPDMDFGNRIWVLWKISKHD